MESNKPLEELDFVFIKERGIGDLISDYLSLLKKIFKHFTSGIFNVLLPLLALFLIFFFFASSVFSDVFSGTQNFIFYRSWDFSTGVVAFVGITLLVLLLFFLFFPTYGLEYMQLLKEKHSTDFTGKEVWGKVREHLPKYIKFFLGSLVVMLVLALPLVLVVTILLFIPLIGQIGVGILQVGLILIFVTALIIYIKDEAALFDSFTNSFKLIKKKLLAYSVSAYIFQILVGICLALLTIVPGIIIAFIALNSLHFNSDQFFTSFTGKILISIGGTILVSVQALLSVYLMGFYSLAYFSSLEATRSEGTLEDIQKIGEKADDE